MTSVEFPLRHVQWIRDTFGTLKVSSIQRCLLFRGSIIHWSISMGQKQVSFIERCPLFGGSFFGGSTVVLIPSFQHNYYNIHIADICITRFCVPDTQSVWDSAGQEHRVLRGMEATQRRSAAVCLCPWQRGDSGGCYAAQQLCPDTQVGGTHNALIMVYHWALYGKLLWRKAMLFCFTTYWLSSNEHIILW